MQSSVLYKTGKRRPRCSWQLPVLGQWGSPGCRGRSWDGRRLLARTCSQCTKSRRGEETCILHRARPVSELAGLGLCVCGVRSTPMSVCFAAPFQLLRYCVVHPLRESCYIPSRVLGMAVSATVCKHVCCAVEQPSDNAAQQQTVGLQLRLHYVAGQEWCASCRRRLLRLTRDRTHALTLET